MGLLHSYKKESQEAVKFFEKTLLLRTGTRDFKALATAHANLSLALIDVEELDLALEHGMMSLNICLEALKLGPIQTLTDDDIPRDMDAQQLLKIMATALLITMHERGAANHTRHG